MASLVMPDPTKIHMAWDDFNNYLATDWIETAVGASTATMTDGDGGHLTLTTAALENDGIWLQQPVETFTLEVGKKVWLKCRLSVGDAIQSDWVFGLHTTSTTPQTATERFLFESVDGSAAVYFNIDDNTTDVDSGTVVTMTDDTFVTLAAYYDGKDTVWLYADGVGAGKMTSLSLPTGEMAMGFGYINGAAGAETTVVDYVLAVKER
jgi:hypothetical protein